MKLFDADNPVGRIVQYAFTVDDIKAATRVYANHFGAGPWFVRGPVPCPQATRLTEPSDAEITIARTFAGRTMIELIQQHDTAPSVYRDAIAARGHGFHHWGVGVRDFDAEVERHVGLGAATAMEFRAPTGARIAYLDTTRALPGMVEIIEMTPAHEAGYEVIFQAAATWDGQKPMRPDP